MRIGVKLLLGFCALGLLAGAIGFLEYREAQRIHQEFMGLRSQILPVIRGLDQLRSRGQHLIAATLEVGLLRAVDVQDAGEEQLTAELLEQAKARAAVWEAFDEYAGLVERYFPEERPMRARLRSAYERLIDTSDAFVAASLASEPAAILALEADLEESDHHLVAIVDEAIDHELGEVAQKYNQVRAALDGAASSARGGGIVALLAAIGLGISFGSSVSIRLRRLSDATAQIGSGRLKARAYVEGRDEIGALARDFNRMADRLEAGQRELTEAQQRIARAQRLALLGQLAGGVAHEIRNPLAVLRNSAYFLRAKKKFGDEEGDRHLDMIDRAVDRAERVVGELLDYARMDPVEAEVFSLKDPLDAAISMTALPPSIELVASGSAETLWVRGSRQQIERTLANLLRNAIQSMPGGGELHVRCERRGDRAIAEIHDTGVGIDVDALERVFEPLYTTRASGIGLGLPLARRYAELHGGTLECESEKGKGSTFRLSLPMSKQGDAGA